MARKVSIKSAADIEMARKAGALAAEVLQVVAEHVRPGVTTDELDRICHDHIVKVQQAIPANIGYHGFPKTICASPNHVICHGIPSSKVLKNGDILNIDVAVIKDGWYGDTSRMYYVGEPSSLARRLVRTTYEAMRAGIMAVRPGATLGDIGHAIQTVAHRASTPRMRGGACWTPWRPAPRCRRDGRVRAAGTRARTRPPRVPWPVRMARRRPARAATAGSPWPGRTRPTPRADASRPAASRLLPARLAAPSRSGHRAGR